MVDTALVSKVCETYKEPMSKCAVLIREKNVDAAKEALQNFWSEHKADFATTYKSVPDGDREEVLKTVFTRAAKYLVEQGCCEETVDALVLHVKEMGRARIAEF